MPRTKMLTLLVAIAVSFAACGGPTVASEGTPPDQLALDDETTTTEAEEQADEATDEGEPTTAAPLATDPPATNPPATDPPATDPPATDPPATDPPATDPPATDPPAAGDHEELSLNLLNDLRSSKGLAPLTRDATMDTFARDWSTTMSTNEFVHSDGPYGENIAWSSASSNTGEWAAELFHNNWVDSPGHYANMTNANYTKIGIGIIKSDNGWYATHVFS